MTPEPPQTPESSENETNLTQSDSDLEDAREFVLDYLRMRIDEEVFHFGIINEISVAIKDKFSQIMLSMTDTTNTFAVSNNFQWPIEETFDINCRIDEANPEKTRVLFRLKIRLIEWPSILYFNGAIEEIIDCLKTYLSPLDNNFDWIPMIQGYPVDISWDKQEKPIPLLIVEQLNR